MSEGNMFEGIGETIEFEIGALDKLFYGANQEYIERQKRFEDGTYTEDDLINHYPRFGIETKDKIELELVESKYFDRLASLYTNLKEIEKSHKEENGKLRVELEQEKEKNKELTKQLNGAFDRGFISKDKIKEIVDEHIPKQPNIITGEMEYTPNTNANSFLVQDILKLLEEK